MSGQRWRGRAPAKVNLSLRVLAREESGFHQLETVYQALELSDAVELEPRADERVELELTGVPPDALGPADENLAVKAAHLIRDAALRSGMSPPGFTIRLEKRIPYGAGLGGGSSDAAAVLLGTNESIGAPFGEATLVALGERLGSDVPFFVSGAPRALAWGRGTRLLPLEPLAPREVLLVLPSFRISTPWAYGVLAEHRRDRAVEGGRAVVHRMVATGDWETWAAEAWNDFESALFPIRPELVGLRDRLRDHGARPALLSGSGAAVFGVFESAEDASRADAALSAAPDTFRTIRTRTAG